MLWVLALLALPADAGTAGYQACCARVGAACPTTIEAIGPGTAITGVGGVRAVGLWRLSCESGAVYLPDASQPGTPGVTGSGTVLTAMGEAAAACFDAICALPPELCVRSDGVRARVVRCGTLDAPPDAAWHTRATEDTSAVVVLGRVLKAHRAVGTQARLATATVYGAGAPPRVVHGSTSVLPGGVVVGMGGLSYDVPDAPPEPCVPDPGMRDASNAQVDEGNEAVVAGELGTALNKYRAAITINACNAFAWAALGDAFLAAGRPDEAHRSLGIATRLMPAHFQAWTSLGRSAELKGDVPAAIAAFERALTLRPGHPPAQEALERLR